MSTKSRHVNLPAEVRDDVVDRLGQLAVRPGLTAQHRRELKQLASVLREYRMANDFGGVQVSPQDVVGVLQKMWTAAKAIGIIAK